MLYVDVLHVFPILATVGIYLEFVLHCIEEVTSGASLYRAILLAMYRFVLRGALT